MGMGSNVPTSRSRATLGEAVRRVKRPTSKTRLILGAEITCAIKRGVKSQAEVCTFNS
jgi:hypothetical protein